MLTIKAYTAFIVAIVFSLLAHTEWLPWPLAAVVMGLLAWRYMVSSGAVELPLVAIKHLLTLSAPVVVWLYWRQWLSLEALCSIVLLGISLKFLEISSRRDSLVAAITIYFFSATAFLFSQTVVSFVCVGIAYFFTTVALYRAEVVDDAHIPAATKRVAVMFLQTIPLVAVLFLVAPRFGPLWSMPLASQSAKTGMSSTLKPGDIASLIQSSELVFRAEFSDENVSQAEMYWRALVLDDVREGVWQASTIFEYKRFVRRPQIFDPYVSLLIEPQQARWLYTLGGTAPGGGRYGVTPSGIYSFIRPPARATRVGFQQVASEQPTLLPSSPQWRRLTTYDQRRNIRLQAWVADQLNDGISKKQLINRLLTRFGSQFYYSLTPPTLQNANLDPFMFDTKTGFCEHYAALTATVARMANIPSRIVTGYLGGRRSNDGSHWVVRQYDAHAWVELYYEGEGWIRLDPTAAVAPERVNHGLEGLTGGEEWVASRALFGIGAMGNLLNQWQDFNYQWAAWMSGFSSAQQQSLLSKITGGTEPWRIALLVISVLFLPAAWLLLLWAKGQYRPHRIVQWQIERAAKKCGIAREPAQSLHGLCFQLAQSQPTRAAYWRNMGMSLQSKLYNDG